MTTLAVWRFDTPRGAGRAAEVLGALTGADLRYDAATVVWATGDGRPRTARVPTTGDRSGGVGDFWGLLFGVLFHLPLLGAAVGAATGANPGPLADVGFPDEFLNRVRDQVTPGTSALFVLGAEDLIDRLRDGLAGDGPAELSRTELLRTALTAEQARALRETFGD